MNQHPKISAKKSLGQHFLHSPSALALIIEAACLRQGESVLEIGPGTGILTHALLEAGAEVTAVEKDYRAYELLKNDRSLAEYAGQGKLKLVNGDILECDPVSMLKSPGSFSIVANIPYYITGAILERFLEHGPRPDKMVLLVQKEVAERIVARDGKESILSVSVKAFGTPKIIATVPRGAFVPPPTVDSAILSIGNVSDRLLKDSGVTAERFFKIIKAGFAHKRKFLIRNLEAIAGPERLEEAWQKSGLDKKARAEDIPVEKWLELTGEIS